MQKLTRCNEDKDGIGLRKCSTQRFEIKHFSLVYLSIKILMPIKNLGQYQFVGVMLNFSN